MNTEQLSLESGYKYLSSYQKKKLLEQSIKLTIQEVILFIFSKNLILLIIFVLFC